MALVSPGVQVTVVDQSNYLPAATNSVPYILVATAQDKVSGSGVGIAAGTLKANANKTYLITSQQDLASTFGVPFFYQTTTGTPINGYELNEYGLLAAYSALGVTNQCYVQRADIDLTALTASLTRPAGNPPNGTYWLDTTNTQWGIFQWNQVTRAFTNQAPIVITDTVYLETGETVPLTTVGSIGNYAVTATSIYNPIYYKRGGATSLQTSNTYLSDLYNTWVLVGSQEWQSSWPTIQGTLAPTSLTAGQIISINGTNVTVPNSPNANVAGLALAIEAAPIIGVYSAVIGGALVLFADETARSNGSVADGKVAIANVGGGTTLTTLGITAGTYYAPQYQASPSYTVPQWNTFSTSPAGGAPTGSVWQKISNVNLGTNIVVKKYNSVLGTFVAQSCPVYASDAAALYALDPSGGGESIAAGSTYAQVSPLNDNTAGFQIFERYATGPSIFTAADAPGTFDVNDTFTLSATAVGTATLNTATVTLTGTTAADFVAAVSAADVPYVSATIDSSGVLVLTHAQGGDIYLATAADQNVTNAVIVNDGVTPYTAGDILTVVGGSSATAATIEVLTVDGGGNILTVQVNNAGAYSVQPANPVSVTGGTGTGATFNLTFSTTDPIATAGFDTTCLGIRDTYTAGAVSGLTCSYWVTDSTFIYTASNSAPEQNPAEGTYWYYSDPTQVDIMIQNNGVWNGYQNCTLDARGYNLSLTNATGPIISATPPTTQTNTAASPLVVGDLWVNTSDLENYPLIYRWQAVNGQNQWVQISNTDQTTSNGILFADARWAPNGTTNPITDPLPAINTLLTSNYLDIDAPNAELYATGTLLFNTRRSGFNVKTFQVNYFNQTTFPTYTWAAGTAYVIGDYVQYNSLNYVCIQNTSSQAPTNTAYWSLQTQANTWLTASGNKEDGSPYMGRQAQRAIIVEALKAGVDSNTTIREEQNQFNLQACPNYPELAPNLVALNNDRGDTGFVIVDTPMRLAPADVVTWSSNNSGLGLTTNDGLLTNSTYAGTFYPSCLTNDLAGNPVVCPPSYMMTRTIIRSDQQSYPWFAPAGTQRGVIDNAYQIGYINGTTGEFSSLQVGQGLRDVLYTHQINPITFIPGVGITNFGNKTLQATTTALDRINVARLVAFLRGRLKEIGNNYLFQPNDSITRSSIAANVTSLMIDLIAKRGIYDYLVVCDSSNNTPARIDRNELWVDVAIEPVKAVEFIYIPLRIENTGAIAGSSGGSAVSAGGSGTAGT